MKDGTVFNCCINTQCGGYLTSSPTAYNLCWCFNVNAGTDILSEGNEESSTSFSLYSLLTGARQNVHVLVLNLTSLIIYP